MSDTLEIFGQEYTNVIGFKATDSNDNVLSYSRSQSAPALQTKTITYTPTTTAITDTVTADSGYDGLDEVDVTVSAVPVAEYVGQATVPNGTHDITVYNDGTIASYYEGGGNVPVIATSGYASSSDEVFVYANSSETIQMQTQAAQTIYPSSSDQSISSGKYLTGSQTIKAVTTTNLTAANIKSGVTVQVGDSADSDRVLSVTGTYSGGSSMNIQIDNETKQRTANSYGDTGLTLTVAKTGTYTVTWTAWRGSSSGTMGTNLHVNSTTGTNYQTWTGTYGQRIELTNQSYSQGDVLRLYATSGNNSRTIYVANLTIIQTA